MGRKAIDLTGKRFGRWFVARRNGGNKDSKPMWFCECDCGNTGVINGASLKRGDSTSCGCYIREKSTKHGMYKTRLNKTYRGLKQRCYNKKNTRYAFYGGQGVKMCAEWLGASGAVNFMDWALDNGYSDKLSIDRIDPYGDYSPDNCRWITMLEQSRNRRVRKNSKSGVTGVSVRKNGNWRASIVNAGKNVCLGTFKDVKDAIKARKKAEQKYWGKGV